MNSQRIKVTGRIDGRRCYWCGDDAFFCTFRGNDGQLYSGRFPGNHVSSSVDRTVTLEVSHKYSNSAETIIYVKNVRAVRATPKAKIATAS